MITVTEARHIIAASIHPLPKKRVGLKDAEGLMLASDCFARSSVPAFDQSGMDGYAIWYEDRKTALKISGVIPAGYAGDLKLKPTEAIRILTGAPVPAGADTIVIQEKVSVSAGTIEINDEDLQRGANIRKKGSEIDAGDLALSAGSYLSAGALGFLASVGIDKVDVHPLPRVRVIITGSELVKPGNQLEPGQVYESNSLTIKAALQRSGITEVLFVRVSDDETELVNQLKTAIAQSDLVLLTGGISVGDYDYVLQATRACGVSALFHKVKQRPGKPLYFGMHQVTSVFGLPGNPSSVLTCLYEYVLPAIAALTNNKNLLNIEFIKLASSWKKPAGLTHFLKGIKKDGQVHILDAQESYKMSSFALANCLIVLPEEQTNFEQNDVVEIHLIP